MSTRMRGYLLGALVAPFALASAQVREQTEEFKWNERIDAGRSVKATNINGTITVRQGSGDRVEVTAVKRWRRGDPASVRISARKDGGDIRVCPLYDDQDDCNDNNDRNRRRNSDNRNDVVVDFTILVPRGVHLVAGTVNGAVSVAGVTEDVEVATVNGDLTVESGRGRLTASTVQGAIHARVNTRPSAMEFTTVNGGILLELSSDMGADVEMTTVNGEIRSDFGVVVTGRWSAGNIRTHVGPAGGPRARLTTVNGSIELRKR